VRYFTPDLLAKCRSSDPDVAEAAAVKWQGRAAAYRKRLREIEHDLPPGVRRFIRSVTLHDAPLLTMNDATVGGRAQLFLTFRLADGDNRPGIQLRYALVKPMKVAFHAPNASADGHLFALYDEVDLSADGTLTHSILMTTGVEIRVRFTNLLMTRLTRIVAPCLRRSDITGFKEMVSP
jgi:hypothetical protein